MTLIQVQWSVGRRLLLVVVLAAMVVWGQAGSLADAFGLGASKVKHFTGPLGADRSSTVALKIGQVVEIDVVPVGGRTPVLQVVRHDSKGYEGVLVPVRRSDDNKRYRAIAAGRTDIGGVSRQVLDRCQRSVCIDLMGEIHFVVSVIVTG